MIEPGYVTISVDDGHPTDVKAAELLAKYDLHATFYVPARNPERAVMRADQIREIAAAFEVGSHTFNHKPLKHAGREEARSEIENGKTWLEDTIGHEAVSFCYPQGKFRAETIELVKRAGFLGARTCMFNLNDYPANPFLWGVSTHAYSHSMMTQIRHGLLERNFRGLSNFALIYRFAQDWARHFWLAMDSVEQHGGIAHLYFHSWEIDEHNEWSKLENLLENISSRKTLVQVTNGDLFARWHAETDAVNTQVRPD